MKTRNTLTATAVFLTTATAQTARGDRRPLTPQVLRRTVEARTKRKGSRRAAVAMVASVLIGLGCGSQPVTPDDSGLLVLTGGIVIDGTGAEPMRDAVVVVSHGRIEHIGDSADYAAPSGATVLDMAGRWLVPAGMWSSRGRLRESGLISAVSSAAFLICRI